MDEGTLLMVRVPGAMLAVSSFCKGNCTATFFVRRLDICEEMICAEAGAAVNNRNADADINPLQHFLQYRFSRVVMVIIFT